MKTTQIATWVREARSGDAVATDALVRAFLRPAYVVALAVLGRPADAEDTAQNAFLTAMKRIHTCREDDKFGAWLLQIVRNQAKNGLMRRKLRDVPEEDSFREPSVESTFDAPDQSRDLLTALRVLSATQREIILLHDLEGWLHGEIAAVLGMSEANAQWHLFVARRVLRAKLEQARGDQRGAS